MNIIEAEGINKFYGNGQNRVHVLKDVTFSVAEGDFVAIIGQSGSGKSTLMNILGCLDTQSSGVCRIGGVDIGTLNSDGLAELRGKRIGFIFQRYNLLSTLSATENVALPAIYAGVDRKARLERARTLLTNLGLDDKLENRPNELSGGQQQRVSIARALMNGGSIILADEPTGALDSKSGENVMDILTELNRQGHTIIVVTHDHHIAGFASRVIEIKDGAIISDTRSRPFTPAPERGEHKNSRPSLLFRKDQFVEAFKMSVQAILAHKMRSVLTMLGIIIGIASVVSVVALGRGSQAKIIADISSMGTNTINVYPGKGFGDRKSDKVKTLTVADSEILGKQSYIASATPNTTTTGTLVYRNISVNAQLSGVGEQYFDVKGLKPAMGRFFNADDVKANASYVVIDDNTWKKLFPEGGDPVGKVLLFNRQPLEIIAVAEKQDTVFGPTDTLNLWAPYTTVMHKITGQRHISSVIVKVKDSVMPLMAEKNLTALLTARHGKEDFFTVKGVVEELMNALVVDVRFVPVHDNKTYHPGRCADIYAGDVKVGTMGELHPAVTEAYDMTCRVYCAEFDIPKLFEARGDERKYKALPKYPAVTRDLSLVCDDEVTSDEIIDIIKKSAKHLESVSIFDMYKGEQVPEGKKSLSYNLVLRKDGSMTDEEADAVVAKVLKALAEKNITLRA